MIRRCGRSPSDAGGTPTILRFCRAVGCEGFKDLKFRLIQELALTQAMNDQAARTTKAAGVPASL